MTAGRYPQAPSCLWCPPPPPAHDVVMDADALIARISDAHGRSVSRIFGWNARNVDVFKGLWTLVVSRVIRMVWWLCLTSTGEC